MRSLVLVLCLAAIGCGPSLMDVRAARDSEQAELDRLLAKEAEIYAERERHLAVSREAMTLVVGTSREQSAAARCRSTAEKLDQLVALEMADLGPRIDAARARLKAAEQRVDDATR